MTAPRRRPARTNVPKQSTMKRAVVFLICCTYVQVEALGGIRKPLLRVPRGVEGTGNYVVVLGKDASEENLQEAVAAASKLADGRKIYNQVHTVSKAFAVKLSPLSLELVSAEIQLFR